MEARVVESEVRGARPFLVANHSKVVVTALESLHLTALILIAQVKYKETWLRLLNAVIIAICLSNSNPR